MQSSSSTPTLSLWEEHRDSIEWVRDGEGFAPSRISSVVVATHNRPADLESCLASLRRQSTRDFEVIVADDASEPAPDLQRTAVRHVRFRRNMGASMARNLGSTHASSSILIFLDDDAIAAPELVSAHLAAMSDPHVAAARGRLLPKHPEQLCNQIRGVLDLGETPLRGVLLNVEANTSIRRETFEKAGGWKSGLMGGEGIELTKRLLAWVEKEQIVYAPAALAYHDEATSVRHLLRKRARYARSLRALFAEVPGLRELAVSRRRLVPPAPTPPSLGARARLAYLQLLLRFVTRCSESNPSFVLRLLGIDS